MAHLGNRVKGVIFDVGATLIDFPGIASPEAEAGLKDVLSFARTWTSFDGSACKHELMRAFTSLPKEDEQFRQISSYRKIIADVVAGYGLELSEEQLERLEDSFLRPILESARPVEGVMDILVALEGQVKLAVTSNTRAHKLIIGGLETLGFERFFNPIVTSMNCGYRKPSKLIFEAILDAWNLPSEQTVMIGDKLATDISGAKALGIRTLWFNRKNAAESDLPDATATNAQNILQILSEWC